MKQTLYLMISCLFLSCQAQKQTPPVPSIKGDWQGIIKYSESFRSHNRYMTFDDSLCTNSAPWGTGLKYHIKNDTVFFEQPVPDKYNQNYQYAIQKLTTDSLVLLAPATKEYPADTIALCRIRKRNNLKPSAIYFASSGCFGTCPSMLFEIDSARNFLFFGLFHTDPNDGFRGKLSEAEYATILNQVNNLPVDSLKGYYRAPWTDDQTCGVGIEAGGKLIKSTAYGTYREPVELTILLDNLLNLYKHVRLSRDTTITIDYFQKHPARIPTTELTTHGE